MSKLVSATDLLAAAVSPAAQGHSDFAIIFDCRFSLADPGEGGQLYRRGHIPGAFHIDLNKHLSAPPQRHGGRHPLPDADQFVAQLAQLGVGRETQVVAYDDSRFAFAARLWWIMRSLGFKPPLLLNGGYQAWLEAGGKPETAIPSATSLRVEPASEPGKNTYRGCCDIDALRSLQMAGATLVDSREAARYEGREEPIDPVAGHIPGAINKPWLNLSDNSGCFRPPEDHAAHWGEAIDADNLVVYCGSGVTACVNLFSLAALGRDDAILYNGSWSDWCSYL